MRAHGLVALAIVLACGILSFVPRDWGPSRWRVMRSIALIILATIIAVPSTLAALAASRCPPLPSVPAELAISHSARQRSLRDVERRCDRRELQSDGRDDHHGDVVPQLARCMDAEDLAGRRILRVGYIGQSAFLAPKQLEALGKLRRASSASTSARFAQLTLDPSKPPLTVVARDLDPSTFQRDTGWRCARSRMDPKRTMRARTAFRSWISEAAADRFGARPGRQIELPLGATRGSRRFAASGATTSIRTARCSSIARELRAPDRATGYECAGALARSRTHPSTTVQQQHPHRAWRLTCNTTLRTPRELRRMSLQVFDRTFAVTYVLEIVAIVIGLFGISAGISAQVLARRRSSACCDISA